MTKNFESTPYVLLIDDDPLIVRFLEKALSRSGVSLDSALNATEGVNCFRQNPKRYRIIILDLSLADQSWRETVDQLKSIDPDARIVISSGSVIQDQSHENDSRIFAHLPKPFLLPDLLKHVES